MRADPAASPTLIQSLQRGMRLVEAVTLRGPLTARELSDWSGIMLPTTYHLVRTLVHEGYLRRLADGRYSVGGQMSSVNQLEYRARSLRLIREGIAELAAEARVNVSIGELCNGEIVVTQSITHPSTPRFESWRGMTLPGHATAIGKNILGRMSAQHRADYLAGHPLDALTTHTVTTPGRLEHELAAGDSASSNQEFAYGISCVAVPLASDTGLMALGAAFSSSRPQRAREQIVSTVARTAAHISSALGVASQGAIGFEMGH
ncbi:IclR family transcriptional regulator [[Mycobacterium] nativiensis]|uniref:IclR family transcriptional regulator C-terminal domain-containing protein n=1 Tax=[Mycobacterium] nativiensis TaxID=2855503 RepID=A0ABU5Y1E5_9MYCO|nr:IclR family transcriptional regulator C-terminal domain-containing protein [Mycolicibacter sp. MYC340]MEB3034038.1 IclR family transcriptional regulator C-terminal domain-containing protein [Mycolicibacter sp. MYC340]